MEDTTIVPNYLLTYFVSNIVKQTMYQFVREILQYSFLSSDGLKSGVGLFVTIQSVMGEEAVRERSWSRF